MTSCFVCATLNVGRKKSTEPQASPSSEEREGNEKSQMKTNRLLHCVES